MRHHSGRGRYFNSTVPLLVLPVVALPLRLFRACFKYSFIDGANDFVSLIVWSSQQNFFSGRLVPSWWWLTSSPVTMTAGGAEVGVLVADGAIPSIQVVVAVVTLSSKDGEFVFVSSVICSLLFKLLSIRSRERFLSPFCVLILVIDTSTTDVAGSDTCAVVIDVPAAAAVEDSIFSMLWILSSL